MSTETLVITASDGARIEATVFAVAENAAPVVLVWPAMGVSARFYQPLGESLNRAGFNAVTADLRGIGSSSLRASRGVDFGYREMVELDFPAAIAAVRERFASSPVWLLGHSLGGQLAALHCARQPDSVQGLLLVACGSVHYRGWRGGGAASILLLTQVAAAVASVLGYFPGKRLGFGGTEARTVIHDWARLGRSGLFKLAGTAFDYEAALARLNLPVLGVSLAGDRFAPRRAMAGLLQKMRKAKVQHLHVEERMDHFSWVKSPELIVQRIAKQVRG